MILLAIALTKQRWKSAFILMTYASLNLGVLAPYIHKGIDPPPPPQFQNTQIITLLTQNFYYKNSDLFEMLPILEEENPNIFIIHEAGTAWIKGKALFQTDYPYSALTKETGIHGIYIGSKIPGSFKEIPLGSEVGLEFTPDTGTYRILAVHPTAPINSILAEERNRQFEDIAEYVQSSPLPVIVAGDFNTTPFSPYFQDLLRDSGLTDARQIFGFLPTWHVHNPLFNIPIDFILSSQEWAAIDLHRIAATSSDHWGLSSSLYLKETKSRP